MTSVLNQENFDPIHEAHAIEQAAFIVQFDRPLNDTVFKDVKEATKQFENELPGKVEIQGVSFAMGMTSASTYPATSEGTLLRLVLPDGTIHSELRVERSMLTFLTTRYTGWNLVFKQVCNYFNVLLPHYFPNAALIGASLNYVDKFVWNGPLENCNPKLLIREDSKYLCNHIFETKELWHSHTGVFSHTDEFSRRLLNINVNYLDELNPEEQKRVIIITTSIADQFNQQNYKPLDNSNSESSLEMIKCHMQEMHNFNKEVLGQIITQQMCERIALI
jgi:uncharacterized protein (TIGR04255 family)